jgi:hypothetical protein
MDKKYEHAKFIIERFDHYYDTVNNKSSFYIGLNTFILGSICAGYIGVGNKVDQGIYFWMLLILIFSLCIVGIVYTINAISPFLKDNENRDDVPSRIFFGGIARYKLNDFLEKCKEEDDHSTLEDMYRQVHCLANGLDSKFKNLKVVSLLLLFQIIIISLFCFYIIKNYTA